MFGDVHILERAKSNLAIVRAVLNSGTYAGTTHHRKGIFGEFLTEYLDQIEKDLATVIKNQTPKTDESGNPDDIPF
jgi:hypothetical protein